MKPRTSKAERQNHMKNLAIRWFPRRWIGVALMLTVSATTLFAQVFNDNNTIKLDFTLYPGGSPDPTDFLPFFNNSSEAVVLSGGSIFGRSPEAGDMYFEKCPGSGFSWTFPGSSPTTPIQAGGIPGTFVNAHEVHFEAVASTGNTATYPTADANCVPYWVDIHARLAGGRKTYEGTSFRSAALFSTASGAPPDVHAITEEVGALRVRLKCIDSNLPDMLLKAVANGPPFITAIINEDPSILPDGCGMPYWDLQQVGVPQVIPGRVGTLHATVLSQDPAHLSPDPYIDETFLVRANHSYKINVKFKTGGIDGDNIGECDLVSGIVLAGKVTLIDHWVDPVFCDQGPNRCLAVDGRLAMLDVANNGDKPLLQNPLAHQASISDGPWNNSRAGVVDPVPPSPMTNYNMWTVVPSTQVTPWKPYTPSGTIWFQPNLATMPNGYEYMELPPGPDTLVDCATTVHLGLLLVIDPGFVTGQIQLCGPKGVPSCLDWITTTGNPPYPPSPPNGQYWNAVSSVFAGGGASVSSKGGGRAWASIDGAFTPQTTTTPALWNGFYEEWLGGLNQETSSWNIDRLDLVLYNPATPTLPDTIVLVDHLSSGQNKHKQNLVVVPQQNYVNDHDYCFSEVRVEFINPGNVQIANPFLECIGGYGQNSPLPNPLSTGLPLASYTAGASFYGTPTVGQYTAGPATVLLCLPTGDYTLKPRIDYQIGGTSGFMGSRSFTMTVGCKMVYDVQIRPEGPGPIVTVTSQGDGCTSLANYTLQGSVEADTGSLITEVSYTLNNNPPVTLYSGAGVNSFNLGSSIIPLQPCANTIVINAVDNFQPTPRVGKATIHLKLDNTPPVISGCTDIFATAPVGNNGNFVTYPLPTAFDYCDGPVPVNCVLPPGSFFPIGQTVVTCTAKDKCENTSTCQFTVTVTNPCPELVINGSFETTSPVVAPNNYDNALDPITGVPPWTTTSQFLEVWRDTFGGIPASDGTNQLEINAQSDNETVTQVVTGLSTNCPATFCFDYTGRFGLVEGGYNNDFTVTLSGGWSLSVPLNPAIYSIGGWQTFCTNFIPLSSAITVAFHGEPHLSDGTPAFQGGAHIDNVSLTQCCCAPNTTLKAMVNGGNIVITWSGANYHLQTSTSLGNNAVWSNVPGPSPITLPLSETMRYFRLVCP